MGLKSLRITCLEAEEEGVEGACDSSLGRDTPLDDLGFPVEILPHLYLGNAQNSGDRDALNRHKIRVSRGLRAMGRDGNSLTRLLLDCIHQFHALKPSWLRSLLQTQDQGE